jgi:hypothetical protein
MSSSSNIEILAKSLKIEGKNSSSGIWLHYNQEIQGLEYNHVNKDLSYVGELQKTPITPDIIFVGQNYPSLTFAMDFLPGSNTTVTSERKGLLPLTISKNNLNVSYTPMETTDMFTFSLYSGDNSSERTILKEITIDTIDVIPTYIEGNPTINTLNNLYTGLTMNFFENVDAGTVTTFSSESSVSNVIFSNGKCSFDYRTPTTHTSDKIIFTNLRNERIQVINKAPQNFELTNLKLQPVFSSWLLTPASQNFSYINTDFLSAIFTKDIQTCSSITASSGLPSTITPTSIIGNKINFEWSSLNTGNVTFTFNGLTAVDGSIDANVDGLTTVGPVILNTPATIIGWNGVQPNEPNTLYNVSVTFTKQLSTSRTPVITSSDTSNPVFTSISGSQVNFTVTTSSNPDYTVYTFDNVAALDGSIKNGATISAGAKIVSVQVETDITSSGSYITMSKLVKLRAQKVKIFLSKPIVGTLSLVTNSNCTFGAVTMITSSIAEFRITPFDNGLSLTIESDNIICQEDNSQSTISHTFDLVYNQTVLNLFETSNKNSSKTTFDVGTDVALSLEVSKEILDLSSTTITCDNAIISNITFTSELGRYYYNFNLLPTLSGTNETIYINKAKDLNGFKYDIFKSSLNFANVFPKTISYFGGGLSSGEIESSFSLRKDVFKTVTITLSGVTSQTPTAYVYYSYTSDSLSPTLLGTYYFSPTGSISFPFTPTVLGTVYFYIKGITIMGFVQPDFLISPGVSVLWFAPSSASLVFSLNGATSGDDYNVMGLASGKTYSDVLISLQWADNISNPLNIAETGAVQLYIGGTVVPNGITSYTYNSITNNILIGSINPGSRVGNLYISITLTSPAGTTIDIETLGHTVYAVPDTVSIATISDGYSLINSKEIQTKFFFSHTNTSINSLITILDTGFTNTIVNVTSTAIIELDTSITIPRNIGAKVTSTNIQQTFTFMFLSTRTTVQVIVPLSNIYTFPESSTFTITSDGISKGSVVTLNKISSLIWTFPNSLPSSVIHTITATGATISSSIASPLTSSRVSLVYKLTPTIKQNIVPTVSVTFGGVTVTYTETVLLAENIYKLPSGLSAVVSFVGSSTSDLDSFISTLAIGASYGSDAGNALCGPGNTSSILLTLTDFDSVTENTNEITKVTCVNSSTLVAVGTDPTYTYTSSTHSASIKLYTVPTDLTSSVKFSVIVTAPDGYTTTLNSTQTFLTELGATTASLGSVATGITFVSGSNVNVPVTFSNAVGVLTPSTLISTNGTFSAISTSVISESFSATYTGEATNTDITFTVAPTQRRIIVSVPASDILVWPTSASTAPVNSVTIGIASAMKTTLSSSVQSSVTASFGSLTASDSSTGSSLSTPSVSGTFVTYTITTTSEATYTSSVTLSVSTYSKTYNQTIVNADQIYVWPTGVEAVLSLNGATSGSDYNILGFAAGRTYSSSVTLSLKGIDPSPVNTSEVAASGAIRVYVSGTLVSNVVTSYTYISNTHEVIVNSMTLGVQTGALQFGVTVTAPSGSTYELLSSGHTVYAVPDTVTIGTIGSGYSLIASNPIATTFTFSHTNNTLNNSLGTLATGASSSTLSLVSTATVTLSSSFGTSKVLNATVTASASQQTFTFMFASTRTTAISTVLSSAIYSFPTSVTFSQPPFAIGSSTIVTATTNTTLPSGMSWVITASLGTIGSGSGTTLYSSTQLSFTYTAVSKSEVTGTLTLTWNSLSCTLTSTLATVSGIYNSPTTLTYDGASLNPTFYSRHFKHGTAGSVKLMVDGELILGSPEAITNAVSSVTYSQIQTAALYSIYATNTSGTTKTGGYNTDTFSSTLLVAFPGDSLSDVSHLINTSTTAKTLTTKSGSSVTTTTSKFYGSSVSTFTSGLTGAIRFGNFATNITSTNFTVEMWVNVFNTSRAYTPLFCTRPLTTNTLVLAIAWSGAQPNGYSPGALHLRTFGNTSYVGSSYNVTSNAWHHIAMTKSGTTYKVYLNGTLGLTSTISESIPGGTQFILGGMRAPAFGDGSDDADDAQAYFNDLRFYTTVKYTENFSVDSTPITTTTTASLAGATFTSSSFTIQMTPTVYQPMTITTVLNMPSAGTKTLTCSVPLSDFYTYIYPTTITSISPTTEIYTGDSTLMTFNLSPVDGAPNATAIIYQASTSSSTTPTQVSTSNGTATGAGVLTASCTFPTLGTWFLYALISSPSGIAATTRIVCSIPITVSTYVMPTTMTYDGSSINQATFGTGFGFKQNVSSDVILTFARLYTGNPPNISNAYSSVTYTQPSSSVFPPIYITSSTGAKIGGVNSDPFASWLVLAIPGNALLDVSNSINSSSTTKGVYAFGSGVVTSITQSKFYGSSIYIPGWVASANTGIKVTGMPTGFLYGDWTAEGWFYLTTLNTATLFKLGVCTNPSSVSNTTTNPTIRLLIESATTSWVEITAGAYYQASFSSSVFAINQWFHVALVRSASPGNKGIFTVFVNGTARTLTQNLATGTRPVGDPGTIMFVGTNDDTNTNSCNINGYVQDVRFYVTSKYTSNFSVSATPISKTATLVSSTSTSLRLAITPDYYDTITFSASLKGPGSTTGIATTTTSLTDIVPAPAAVQSSTISARYLRLTLFYAGGTGTSGPSFPKLGIYTQSADAYEDTGISSLNIARSSTFISVSGDSAAATTTSMLSCINDTRTSWSSSTSGTTFGTTKTTGPAYYTIDIGSIQTIAALKFAEVTYESTGWQWFSTKIEFSTDNVSWNLAHLVNATGNETQPYLHSGYSLNSVTFPPTVTSIYSTDTTGVTKTGGYNVDSYASSLIVALPFDSLSEVSNSINPNSTIKTVTPKANTRILTTTSAKFYGKVSYPSAAGTSSCVVSGLPTSYFGNDFTLEAWIMIPGGGTGNLFGSDPLGYGFSIQCSGAGELYLSLNSGGVYRGIFSEYAGQSTLPIGSWFHFAFTRSGGSTYKIYVNGTAVITRVNSTVVTGYNTTLTVGGIRQDGSYSDDFTGYMQDVRVYTTCKYSANFSVGTVTSLIGESLVLAVVSRQYKPTSYSFPTSLGAVTGTLSEGISGKLSIVASTTQGATAILAHSSAAPDANGGFTLWESQATIVTSGLSLLLDAGNTESYPGTGTTWTDISGNGRTGTLTNGPTYSSSNGGYIVFDGSNDTVTGTIPASVFSGAHTVSAWVYRRSVGPWSTVFASGGNSCTIVRFMTNGTSTIVGANNAGLVATASGVEIGADHLNQWLHVTMVYEGTANGSAVTVYVYKSGTLIKSNGQTLYWTLSNTGSYNVGYHSSGGSSQWDGYISQVGVYNRALSAAEIDQNYHALKGRYGITGIGGGTSVIGAGTFDSGTLTSIVKPILSGQVYFYVKPTAPGGGSTSSSYVVVGPVTVAPYSFPTSVSVGTCVLQQNVASGTCTLILSSPNFSALTSSSITVTVGGVSATVTSYASSTGTISFTVTPTIVGTATISVTMKSPISGSITTGTVTTTTIIKGLATNVSILSGSLLYNTASSVVASFNDSAGNQALLPGTTNTDALAYAKVIQPAVTPIWVTDSTGNTKTTSIWQDDLGTSLVLALPLDNGSSIVDKRASAGGLAGQPTVVASGATTVSGTSGSATTSGLIVWLDGADPLGTGIAPADGTTITSWVDKSGSGKNCVPVTAGQAVQIYKSSTTGIATGYVSFPGNTGVARVPFVANTFPYNSYTISILCNVTSYDQATHGYIISGPVDPYNLYFGMWSNTFQIWNNSSPWAGGTNRVTSVGTNATFTINNVWAHLCMTYTGGIVRPYVNGVAMNSFSSTQNWTTTAPDIYIGGSPNNSGYYKLTMKIAELRIYNTAISSTEIANLNTYLNSKYVTLTPVKYYGSVTSLSGSTSGITVTGLPSNFGDGDFTIECWAWATSIAGAIFATPSVKLVLNGTNAYLWVNNGTWISRITSSVTISSSTWTHFAVVRYGTTTTLYIGGVACGTTNATGTGASTLTFGNSGSAEYFTGYLCDARAYQASKYTKAFSPNFTLTDIPVSTITRSGQTLSIPITTTSYRTAQVFFSVKGIGVSGSNLEMSTTLKPIAYVSPTSFTYTVGTVYITVPTTFSITTTGATPIASTISVYASTTQSDLSPILVCTSAVLSSSGIATASCTFTTAGTYYIYIKLIDPDGTIKNSYLESSTTTTVIAYSLPNSITQSSIETTELLVGAISTAQTLTLAGPNTLNILAANILVFLNTTSQEVSNCTVTGYQSSTGIVTFTASPTVLGMNYLYVKITAPITSSTQTTTLSFMGITNQGFYIDKSNAWSPSQLTTAMWLDISDFTTITTVSGGVSEWRDKSGNLRHAGQSSVTLRPTITNNALNNLPLIVFDGVNDFMDIPTTILQTQSKPSIFYVFVRNNAGSTDGYSPEITFNSTNNGDNGSFHYVKSNGTAASYPMYTAGGWGNYDGAGSYTNGSAEIISFATLTSTSTYSVYKNGTLEGSAAAGNALTTFTGFRLAQQQGSRTSGISFGEIILVLNATSSNRESIEGYLAWKWGIQSKLPSNHPYKSGAGMVGSSYAMPISFTFTPIAGYVDGASSNMTITTLGGSTDSAPITVYYSSIANATSITGLTQAGTGTLSSRTSTVSVAIPGGNWYVYIRITSPNAAVGPVILSSFTIASSTATFYYPFVSDIKNYTTGVGVSDAVMGVAGNLSGGTAIFSEKSLVLTGSSTHNAAGASYVVLPSTSSGNTSAFSCWFKSNNNGNFTRIIDMASNGSFRLYITGSNTLNFNDVYTISTTTNINNNTWNFIAINTTATTISWVINSGDAGNSGSGSISSKPVNFTASVGYLGHSFGGDPEFAGSLKEVRFFANANLTSEQISTMYAGTTLLTSRQYTQATSIVSFTPAIPVQSATTTFAVTLGGYETVVNGTSSLYYSAIDSDTNPTLIGTAALLSGVVTVSGSVPLNTFYLYARSISPTSVQGSLLVSSLVTPRAYSFPTSITFTTIQVNVNTQLTFAPADGLASANVIIYYHATNTSTNPTECGTGTISSSGIANITCSFPSGSAVYVYARVTSPAGIQGSLLISSITGTAAPVITITSSSGEIATRTFNGATYTCIRSSGTLTVHKAISGAEIFIIAGGGGGSFSAGGGGGAGGAAYISNASIPAGTYAVTVGAGGAGSSFDGGNGTNGTNSVGFGITVYGGGGGHHTSTGNTGGCGGGGGYGQNSVGGGVTTATGSLSGITGNVFTYGNAGGGNPTPNSYVGGTGAGGGIGGVGGSATATPTGGTGGVGRSIWSDWCAACGVGEGDTSGVFWIGGGGGGTSNETSGVRRAGDGGKGGGGKGGFATSMTVVGFDGCATGGLDYSGGGGGGGHITLPASLAQGYVPPGGRGGSGVIMIKQATTGVYTTINAPTDIAGLQVWLDGSDPNNGTLPVNGSTIGTWVDKVTGNLRSATPVNSANKAVYRSAGTIGGIKNTLGTMYFNNTPYKIPYTGISPTYTIFSVFRAERGLLTSGLSMTPVTTNSSCYILSGGQESCLYFGMLYDQFSTAVGVPPSTWYGMAVNTPATFIRSQWVIATMQYSAATKTTTTFLNGITMTPKGPDATAQNNGNAWNDFFIGQSATSADYRLQGYIGEILIYNSVLSTVDRKKVESYLSLKYGLGIAITRMYTFPTNITFTSLRTSASSTTLSFSPADGFESASVIIYYHATNSSTSPTQCGTGIINSSGSATITCTLPENQVVYIYAKVTSPTGVEGSLICSTLSGTVSSLPILRFPTPGSAGTGISNSVINNDGSWTYNGSGYIGVVVNKTFIGNFTLVLLWACSQNNAEWYRYSVIGMGAKASAQPSDFIYNTGEFYGASGIAACLPGYTTTGWYNSNWGPGGGFLVANWQNTYYQYKRVGTTMEYFYGISANGPWTSIRSATIGANDQVLCIIGTAAGAGITTASVISLTTP